MFIIKPITEEEATGELKQLYKLIENTLGFIPPHFKLLATLDFKAMKDFIQMNKYFMQHKTIDYNLLPFLRLYIANKECRNYCIDFNTLILQKMKIDMDIINDIPSYADNLPFDEKQIVIFKKVIKSLYHSDEFTQNDLKELYSYDISNKDFFDLISYATNFMSKSKLIEIYLDKV